MTQRTVHCRVYV